MSKATTTKAPEKTVKPIPEGYHTITPGLCFKDSKKAMDWYQTAFGATINGEICACQESGKVMHAELKIGDSIYSLGDEMPEFGCVSAETLKASPIKLYVYVKDCDAAFNKAIKAGATVAYPISDMFWGDRVGGIKDPFGYTWSFATHKHDYTKEQIEEKRNEWVAQMKAMKPGSCSSKKS